HRGVSDGDERAANVDQDRRRQRFRTAVARHRQGRLRGIDSACDIAGAAASGTRDRGGVRSVGVFRRHYAPSRRGRNTTKGVMEKFTAKLTRMASAFAVQTGMNCAAATTVSVVAVTATSPEPTNPA